MSYRSVVDPGQFFLSVHHRFLCISQDPVSYILCHLNVQITMIFLIRFCIFPGPLCPCKPYILIVAYSFREKCIVDYRLLLYEILIIHMAKLIFHAFERSFLKGDRKYIAFRILQFSRMNIYFEERNVSRHHIPDLGFNDIRFLLLYLIGHAMHQYISMSLFPHKIRMTSGKHEFCI